ncbi:15949_t:CDS:1, partial [Racocetra persica]
DLHSLSIQSSDELVIDQSDSLILESQDASEENETDISDRKDRSKKQSWVWKYFELEKVTEVIKKRSNHINVKATYCTCLVLNDLDKNCNT